jgi:hypothetical protein
MYLSSVILLAVCVLVTACSESASGQSTEESNSFLAIVNCSSHLLLLGQASSTSLALPGGVQGPRSVGVFPSAEPFSGSGRTIVVESTGSEAFAITEHWSGLRSQNYVVTSYVTPVDIANRSIGISVPIASIQISSINSLTGDNSLSLTLDPTGQYLFATSPFSNGVYRIQIGADGSLDSPQLISHSAATALVAASPNRVFLTTTKRSFLGYLAPNGSSTELWSLYQIPVPSTSRVAGITGPMVASSSRSSPGTLFVGLENAGVSSLRPATSLKIIGFNESTLRQSSSASTTGSEALSSTVRMAAAAASDRIVVNSLYTYPFSAPVWIGPATSSVKLMKVNGHSVTLAAPSANGDHLFTLTWYSAKLTEYEVTQSGPKADASMQACPGATGMALAQ